MSFVITVAPHRHTRTKPPQYTFRYSERILTCTVRASSHSMGFERPRCRRMTRRLGVPTSKHRVHQRSESSDRGARGRSTLSQSSGGRAARPSPSTCPYHSVGQSRGRLRRGRADGSRVATRVSTNLGTPHHLLTAGNMTESVRLSSSNGVLRDLAHFLESQPLIFSVFTHDDVRLAAHAAK